MLLRIFIHSQRGNFASKRYNLYFFEISSISDNLSASISKSAEQKQEYELRDRKSHVNKTVSLRLLLAHEECRKRKIEDRLIL